MEGKEPDRKRKRTESFNREDKIALVKAIELRPCLWDITDKKHFDQISLRSAWESVGAEVKKEANDCRSAWHSLRDSLRYHRGKRSKSGSAGGLQLSQPQLSDTVDWEFAQFMAFLPDMSSERRTTCSRFLETASCSTGASSSSFIASPLNSPDEGDLCYDDIEVAMGFRSEESNSICIDNDSEQSTPAAYTYKKSKKPQQENQGEQQLLGIIGKYFENGPKAERAIFPFWNELLSRLPPNVATDTEIRMTTLLHGVVKEHEQNNS